MGFLSALLPFHPSISSAILTLRCASVHSNKETQTIFIIIAMLISFTARCVKLIQPSWREEERKRRRLSSVSLSKGKDTEDCAALLSFQLLFFSCSSFLTYPMYSCPSSWPPPSGWDQPSYFLYQSQENRLILQGLLPMIPGLLFW